MASLFRLIFCLSVVGATGLLVGRLLALREWPPRTGLMTLMLVAFIVPVYPVKQHSEFVLRSSQDFPRIDISNAIASPILWKIWVIGFFASLLIASFLNFRFTRSIKIGAEAAPIEIQAMADDICVELHINPIPVVIGLSNETPLGVGLFKRKIFLTSSTADGDEEDIELVLRHEIYHFKRKHLWIKGLVSIITLIHWFNPAVYCISRNISLKMEIACDEFAINCEDYEEYVYYSEMLVYQTGCGRNEQAALLRTNFIGQISGFVKKVQSVLIGESSQTAKRVERLMRPKKEHKTRNKAFDVCSIVAVLAIVFLSSAFMFEITEDKVLFVDLDDYESNSTSAIGFDNMSDSLDYQFPYIHPFSIIADASQTLSFEYYIFASLGNLSVSAVSKDAYEVEVRLSNPESTEEVFRENTLSPDNSSVQFSNLNPDVPYKLDIIVSHCDAEIEVLIGG